MKRLVRRDRMLDARDRLAIARRGAGRDQDVSGADASIADADVVRAFQHGAALQDGDARLIERRDIGRLEARDLLVLVGDQRRPVEHRMMHRPAEAGRVLELMGEAGRVDQELLRHAAADHAGAADAVFLRDHDLRAMTGRDAGGAHAAGAGADDEEIDLGGHRLWPFFFISARKRPSTSSENLLAQACAAFRLWSSAIGSWVIIFLPTGVL